MTPSSAKPAPRTDAPTGVVFVQQQAQLDGLLTRLKGCSQLAVDTEAASFHRYEDRVYLLQISSRDCTAVVDPLGVDKLERVGKLLADPKVEIVFHDADYDLRLLDRQYGFRATNLFDTRIAAQLLNEPGIGLAALLEKYLGVKLNKKYQRADWSKRPLKQEMLDYAATDTHHLLELRDILHRQLEEAGRLEWAREEFVLLEQVRWTPPGGDEPGYLRMKGAKALKGRALAILRELFQWREDTAKRLDRAAFRIVNNEPLLALSKAPPADLEALKTTPGIGAETASRRGKQILEAIQRALDLPEKDLPRIKRPARREVDPAYEARLDRLKAARNALAQKIGLAPGVLCPNGTLEQIARAKPAKLADLAGIDGMRRWQQGVAGKDLIHAVKDPA